MVHWVLVAEAFLFFAVVALVFISIPVAVVAGILDGLVKMVRRIRGNKSVDR
jgi:hypothetical protein